MKFWFVLYWKGIFGTGEHIFKYRSKTTKKCTPEDIYYNSKNALMKVTPLQLWKDAETEYYHKSIHIQPKALNFDNCEESKDKSFDKNN